MGLLICVLSAASLLGPLGRAIDDGMSSMFGSIRFVLYLFVGAYAVAMMFDTRRSLAERYISSGSVGLIGLMGIDAFYKSLVDHPSAHSSLIIRGGAIGFYTFHGASILLSQVGASILLIVVTLICFLDLLGHSPISLVRKARRLTERGDEPVTSTQMTSVIDIPSDEEYVSDENQDLEKLPRRWRLSRKTRVRDDNRRPEIYDFDDDLNDESGNRVFSLVESAVDSEPSSSAALFTSTQTEGDHAADRRADRDPRSRTVSDKSSTTDSGSDVSVAGESDTMLKSVSWKLPSPSILKRSVARSLDKDELWKRGRILADALATHKVETALVGMTVGPTVTRYELELGSGVKVARVTSLHKDIAYAMAAADVRILAPIPGRSAIGVEVPNERRVTVSLGDVLLAPEVAKIVHPLSVAIGRDISGKATMANLAEMPHVLIAGSTGSGKSSCLNSLLTSILMRTTPDEVRLILIDPKRVELGQYNGVPHLLTPVVTNPKKAANALAWAVREMERRYDLLSGLGARDIVGYNQTVANFTADEGISPALESNRDGFQSTVSQEEIEAGPAPLFSSSEEAKYVHLPYILVVVDELNDLMMVAARDVEDSICRIAQMARAVGIHLVIATQRPSVDVITGLIKANVPSRMAFSVSSLADSRVILDQPGAERLIGKGDMLMMAASSSHPQRLQAPWVSEDEVRKVVGHWLRQGKTDFASEFENVESKVSTDSETEDEDELYLTALSLVVSSQLGSTSMLQRKLKVGFSRAGRLMDLLERRGIVGPLEGSKPRIVLMAKEEYEEYLQTRE